MVSLKTLVIHSVLDLENYSAHQRFEYLECLVICLVSEISIQSYDNLFLFCLYPKFKTGLVGDRMGVFENCG